MAMVIRLAAGVEVGVTKDRVREMWQKRDFNRQIRRPVYIFQMRNGTETGIFRNYFGTL